MYYDLLLSVSEHGTWSEWVAFFLQGIESQARDAVHRSHRIQDLRKQYRTRFQETQASAKLLQVVDMLFISPILTVNQVKQTIGVSFPSANRYIQQLEEAGVLREITGRSRNRMYQAGEILRAIEGPLEAGEG